MVNRRTKSAKGTSRRARRQAGHVRRTRLPNRHEALKGLLAVAALTLSWYGGHQLYQNWGSVTNSAEEFIARQIDAQLQEVMVSGVVYADPAELRAALDMEQGNSLVGFDAQATRERIQDVTWIKSAAVTRELPSTIRLEITEYDPLARLDVGGEVWVIDKTVCKSPNLLWAQKPITLKNCQFYVAKGQILPPKPCLDCLIQHLKLQS